MRRAAAISSGVGAVKDGGDGAGTGSVGVPDVGDAAAGGTGRRTTAAPGRSGNCSQMACKTSDVEWSSSR